MEQDPKTYQPKAPGGFLFAGWIVADGGIIGSRYRLLVNHSDLPVDSGAWVEDFDALWKCVAKRRGAVASYGIYTFQPEIVFDFNRES